MPTDACACPDVDPYDCADAVAGLNNGTENLACCCDCHTPDPDAPAVESDEDELGEAGA